MKVTKKINLKKLGLVDNPDIADEVGNYLIEKILEDCSEGRSSVTGSLWSGLNKKYKKIKAETSGSGKANLELFGDMLDALEFQISGNVLEVGIFDHDQALKADNHCKFSNDSLSTPLPRRAFIPRKDENFRRGIMDEIAEIIADAKEFDEQE